MYVYILSEIKLYYYKQHIFLQHGSIGFRLARIRHIQNGCLF